jgi:hypothetical protein
VAVSGSILWQQERRRHGGGQAAASLHAVAIVRAVVWHHASDQPARMSNFAHGIGGMLQTRASGALHRAAAWVRPLRRNAWAMPPQPFARPSSASRASRRDCLDPTSAQQKFDKRHHVTAVFRVIPLI